MNLKYFASLKFSFSYTILIHLELPFQIYFSLSFCPVFKKCSEHVRSCVSSIIYFFVSNFYLALQSSQEKSKTMVMRFFFRGGRGGGCITVCAKMGNTIHKVFITLIVEILSSKMADPQQKTNNITPDVLEAAEILVMMRQGMRGFLEAQQARYRMPYVYYTSLNPTISQLHYFSAHGIPFSPLYDISPIAPAAYQFSPLAQAQQELYYGMLTSAQCIVGPPRKQDSTGVDFTVGFREKESLQPGK